MTAPHYPVYLDVRGRRCIVLGDGAVATEKAETLRASGADVRHLQRAFRRGDLAGAFLAVDASGDPGAAAAARREADHERVLLNVVDVAPLSDWIAPAVVRRGPLQVAVSTSGESPLLASTLRARIDALLGDEWNAFTTLMGRMRRPLRARGVARDVQLRAYRRLLRSDALDLLRDGDTAGADAIVTAVQTEAERGTLADAQTGEVVLVGAGPGDPQLLTVAAREVLAQADVVYHDALVDPRILSLCRTGATVVDAGKRARRRSASQRDIERAMIDAARHGSLVVRLKGGDPFVFGRGGEEVNALRAAGVRVRVVPGISAAFGAAAAANIPVTHRGVAGSVAVVTGHRAGDADDGALERIARAADTLVVLMPGDVAVISARLGRVLGAARPAALVMSATTPRQRVVRATLGTIAAAVLAAALESPATLVVGDVVNVVEEATEEREPLVACMGY